MFNGLLFTDISPMTSLFSLFHVINTTTLIQQLLLTTVYRDKSERNVLKFQNELRNINWLNLKGYNDPSHAYDIFLNEYTAVYNSCSPLKKNKQLKGVH